MSDCVVNSQSEDETELSIMLESNSLNINTEKEEKIRRITTFLKPLTKPFMNIPTSRRRTQTFQQSHQYTVSASEFLNLATSDHLNELYKNGMSVEMIEILLERKYQKKKQALEGVSLPHRFKRKDFDSWKVSMGDVKVWESKRLLDEDVIWPEMEASTRRELRKINQIEIEKLENELLNDNDNNKLSVDNGKVIPSVSLIEDDTQEESQVKVHSRRNRLIITEDSQEGVKSQSNKIDSITMSDNSDVEFNSQESLEGIFDYQPPVTSKNEKHTAPFSVSQDNKKVEVNNLNSGEVNFNNQGNDKFIENVGHCDKISNASPDNLGVSTKGIDFESIDTSFVTIRKKHASAKDTESINSSQETSRRNSIIVISSSPKIEEEIIDNLNKPNENIPRKLRHRNIVNRNPYMVDRAEYLGLSTRYELSDMADSGKIDSEIFAFLDIQYQKRKKERIDKGIGLGPYNKSSFHKVMEQPGMNDQHLKEQITMLEEEQAKHDDAFVDDNTQENDDFDLGFDDFDVDELEDLQPAQSNLFCSTKPTINSREASPLSILEDSTQRDNNKLVSGYFDIGGALEDRRSHVHMLLNRNISKPTKKRKTDSESLRKDTKNKKIKPIDAFSRANSINQLKTSCASLELNHTKQPPLSHEVGSNYLDLNLSESDDEDKGEKVDKAGEKMRVSKHLSNSTPSSPQKKKAKLDFLPSLGRSVSNITDIGRVNSSQFTKNKSLQKLSNNSLENSPANSSKKKPLHKKGIIGSSFAPVNSPNFDFNRQARCGSYQVEDHTKYNVQSTLDTLMEKRIDFEAARGTKVSIINEKQSVVKNNDSVMKKLWDDINEGDLNKKRFLILLKIKPVDFKDYLSSTKFLNSKLISECLDIEGNYYQKSSITLELDAMFHVITFPIQDATAAINAVKDFFMFFRVALRGGKFNSKRLIQSRKSFINIIKLCWCLNSDSHKSIVEVGLIMNGFLNLLREKTPDPELFCFFSPYMLIYMQLFQKFLGIHNSHYETFKKSEKWIQKKFLVNLCSIQYQLFFIPRNKVYLESLALFGKITRNPLSIITEISSKYVFDVLEVVCALYYFNAFTKVETDWAYFIGEISRLERINKTRSDTTENRIQAHKICCMILKLNKDLNWELEPQLLTKVFRVLASYKFNNIGSNRKQQATIYPVNEPASLVVDYDDGILDLYFKMLTLFTQNYIKNGDDGYQISSLPNDLIPVSSIKGYSQYELQNRAKALLMLWIVLDKDVSEWLLLIIEAMIHGGSYSTKSGISLLKLLVTRISRKTTSIIKKYIGSIVRSMNKNVIDQDMALVFKELLNSIIECLSSSEHYPLKSAVGILVSILKIEQMTPFVEVTMKFFDSITQFWQFAIIHSSKKEKHKIDLILDQLANTAKEKIKIESSNRKSLFLKDCVRYWLFSRSKMRKTAPQVFYLEWAYLGDDKFRDDMKMYFFTLLLDLPGISDLDSEIMDCLMISLAKGDENICDFLRGLILKGFIQGVELSQNLIHLNGTRRVKVTISILDPLINELKASKNCPKLLEKFIKVLKNEYAMISSVTTLNIDKNSTIVRDNKDKLQFIKEMATYLYTNCANRLILPEWTYLETKLQMETTVTLTQRIEYSGDVDSCDLIILLAKSYVKSKDQFNSEFESVIGRVSGVINQLIEFHAISILENQESDNWYHLLFWLEKLVEVMGKDWIHIDLYEIMTTLMVLSKLGEAGIGCGKDDINDRYYHYNCILVVYQIIPILWDSMCGFSEGEKFLNRLGLICAIDPDCNLPVSDPVFKGNLKIQTKNQLQQVYHEGKLLVNIQRVEDERVVFENFKEVCELRPQVLAYLGL